MDEVAEVKNRLEIAEVVGAYLPLKQAGRNLKAPCPFHEERSASFMVSPDRGIYKCFGCGEGGDIFNFVMKMEGVDFREALEMLARKAGVELKTKGGDGGAAKRLRERLYEANELAVKYFQASLLRNAKAIEYVKKRGLSKQTIRDFQIGYAPDSWEGLSSFLMKQGFTAQELVQAGLAGQREGRSTVYDMFRGRVVFTICDREGRPIGFTGRVLDDGVPKYLNTPQTPLYDKSSTIFGLNLAREAIRSGDEAVLVEGQMDVVIPHQVGIKQVVATSGTALTLEHLRTLSKLTKNIKLAFDSDRAGLAATERAIEMGQKLGLTLRMVELPEGVKDADELVQTKGVEALREAITGAKYIVDYLFDQFAKDYDLSSAVGKRAYTDRLAGALRRLGDPVEQDHYVKRLAEKTGTSEEAVRAKLAQGEAAAKGSAAGVTSAGSDSGRREERGGARWSKGADAAAAGQPVRRAVVQAEGRPTQRVRLEELVLGLALSHPLARVALDDLAQEHFSTPARSKVFDLLVESHEESAEVIIGMLGDYAVYAQELLLMAEQEFGEMDGPALNFEAFTLAHNLLLKANAELKKDLSRRIQEAEAVGDREAVGRLMTRFAEIIRAES